MPSKLLFTVAAAYVTVMTVSLTVMLYGSEKHLNLGSSLSNVGFITSPGAPKQLTPRRKEMFNPTNGHTMDMVIRTTSRSIDIREIYCSALRSAALYWSPTLSNITIILDEESKADHKLASQLTNPERSLGFDLKIAFEPPPKDRRTLKIKLGRPGYIRMLWSSFFIDLYTNATIVAWMDTDAMFVTPVIPENIFNGDKLRVIGGPLMNHIVHRGWLESTEVALGRKMPANFMSYFPTYIWRDTFANCRNYIMKHLNVSRFDDAFKKTHRPPTSWVSPVCILLTYAYFFEHDRYDWHLDVDNFDSLADFNKKYAEPGFEVQPGDISPEVHVSIHAKHYDDIGKHNPLKQGYCILKRYLDKLPSGCEKFNETINLQLFGFEYERKWKYHVDHLETWCKAGKGQQKCAEIIHKHYENVKKYYKMGLYDLDLERLRKVEAEAKRVNVTCPLFLDLS